MIENTQAYQARLVARAAGSYRRQRYQPVTALFHFMFVETWPSINWGVVDYLRQPKAGYYALQRAYQPILPSIEPVTASWRQGSPATVRLWAINDTWAACENCRLTWQVRQNAQMLAQGETSLTPPPDVGQMLREFTVTPAGPRPVSHVTPLYNQRGQQVGS